MTRHVRVSTLGELIATLPYALGFRPTDSLVVAGLRGRRIVGYARADLSDVGPGQGGLLLEPLTARGVEAVVLVAMESHSGQSDTALAEAQDCADRLGLAVWDQVIVRDGHWWLIRAVDGPGVPVPDPAEVSACLSLIVEGVAPLADRAGVGALVAPDALRSGAAAPALARLAGELPASIRSGALAGWARLTVASDAGPAPTTADVVARMGLLTLDPMWRDALLAWLLPGSLTLGSIPPDIVATLRRRLPSRDDVAAPPELLSRFAALCTWMPDEAPDVAAEICAMTAVVGWHTGQGALAAEACGRALRLMPDHRLATLIGRIIAVGMAPPDRSDADGRASA